MANDCLTCDDCTETTPNIPNCGDGTYRYGYAPAAGAYILEFQKPSGIKENVQITVGVGLEVEVDRSALPTGYTNEFRTKEASPVQVRLRGLDGVYVNLNDQVALPVARNTSCILVNYDGVTEDTFIALAVPLTYSI